MKIFWSWQSDIDGDISRHFIKECLKNAVDQLNEETTFESRMEVDHDTKDVLGSPSITETIFNKIKNCTVFVGDLTPIASTGKNKKVMNPNVAIEIGYALGLLGDDKVVTIMNESFGSLDDLPFNLRHKRGPVIYSLTEKALKNEIEQEGKKLVSTFKTILKNYITTEPKPQSENFINLDLNGSALFFDLNKPIFRLSDDGWSLLKNKEYFFKKFPSYVYIKVLPKKEQKFTKSEIKKAMFDGNSFKIFPLFKSPDHTPEANKYGCMIVKFDPIEKNLITDFVQVFENGSIISISDSFLFYSKNRIPLILFKNGLEKMLTESINLLENIFQSNIDIEIEVGLVNGDNCTVLLPNLLDGRYYPEPERGPLEQESYITKKIIKLKDISKIDELMKEFILSLLNDIGIEFKYEEHKWY